MEFSTAHRKIKTFLAFKLSVVVFKIINLILNVKMPLIGGLLTCMNMILCSDELSMKKV